MVSFISEAPPPPNARAKILPSVCTDLPIVVALTGGDVAKHSGWGDIRQYVETCLVAWAVGRERPRMLFHTPQRREQLLPSKIGVAVQLPSRSESRTVNKAERQRTDACELWYWRRLLRGFPQNPVQFSRSVMSNSLWPHGLQYSTPGFPVHHQLPELSQTHCHRVGDAIQPSHPLSSPSPSAFTLSQPQGLSQWVSSLHQVAKVLEFHLQHQSFQWIFRLISFRMDWLDLLAVQGTVYSFS